MLQEISTEPLTHLLASVYQVDPQSRSFPSFPPFSDNVKVLEIRGAASSGKSNLLYYLLMICIVPKSHQNVILEGWGKIAIIFDMDSTFNATRFNCMLGNHLQRLLPSDRYAMSIVAQQSLERLYIFRPESSSQLAATLLHLVHFPSSHLPKREIGLLAIDSIAANYWPDRFTSEQLQMAGSTKGGTVLRHILATIQLLHRSSDFLTVVTNWFLSPIKSVSLKQIPPFVDPFDRTQSNFALYTQCLGAIACVTVSKKVDGSNNVLVENFDGLLQAPKLPDFEFILQILPPEGELVIIT